MKLKVPTTLVVSGTDFNRCRTRFLAKLRRGECKRVVIEYHGIELFELRICRPPLKGR